MEIKQQELLKKICLNKMPIKYLISLFLLFFIYFNPLFLLLCIVVAKLQFILLSKFEM